MRRWSSNVPHTLSFIVYDWPLLVVALPLQLCHTKIQPGSSCFYTIFEVCISFKPPKQKYFSTESSEWLNGLYKPLLAVLLRLKSNFLDRNTGWLAQSCWEHMSTWVIIGCHLLLHYQGSSRNWQIMYVKLAELCTGQQRTFGRCGGEEEKYFYAWMFLRHVGLDCGNYSGQVWLNQFCVLKQTHRRHQWNRILHFLQFHLIKE